MISIRFKYPIITLLLLLLMCFPLFSEEKATVALPGHELGDQTMGLSAGIMFPLFFQSYTGEYHDTQLSVGGTGAIQWNAYLSSFFRLGLELGVHFSFGVNDETLLMVPITFKGTFVFNVSRFEFPIFLGAGINIVRYMESSQVDILLKPGFAGYWRYNANWSFGINCVWWLDFQFAIKNQSPDQGRMGNWLELTPSVFYHF